MCISGAAVVVVAVLQGGAVFVGSVVLIPTLIVVGLVAFGSVGTFFAAWTGVNLLGKMFSFINHMFGVGVTAVEAETESVKEGIRRA